VTDYFTAPFAAVYDRYFSGNVASASRVIREFHQKVSPGTNPRILDLCCGTGQLAEFFAGNGYTVVGVDSSAAMLAMAEHRCGDQIRAGTVRLVRAEATDFTVDGHVDLATCTSDSLNHLPDIDALKRAFGAVSEALAPGGYFVFDIHSVLGLRQQNFSIVREAADVLIILKATPDIGGGRVLARVVGCRRVDDSRNYWERFEQEAWITAWPASDVLAALKESGFSEARPCHLEDLSTALADADAVPRIYFVARR
jgi:SAM-dependent methyltransferase